MPDTSVDFKEETGCETQTEGTRRYFPVVLSMTHQNNLRIVFLKSDNGDFCIQVMFVYDVNLGTI